MPSSASILPPATWPPEAPPPDDRYGTASITPYAPVVAGSFGTWTLTYTAGKHGIDDGGALRIAFHTISDWGAPQFADPAAPDYCTVSWSTPAPCRLEARYDGDLGVRPWKRVIVLRVRDAAIRPGDTISVTIGDSSGGSPGARSQTFAGIFRLQVLLDAYGTGIFVPAGQAAQVRIVAGPADHLRVHAPSDVTIGRPFTLTVVVRDRWGNVLSHRRRQALLDATGVHHLRVDDSDLTAESNPIRCHPVEEPPPYRIFWGDLHAQTEETIGSGTLDEYFAFARNAAAIDFVGHQGNDFQVTRQVWDQIMAKTQAYDSANDFITFAGYEWSGNTPGGGDHNVHFRGGPGQQYDLHRSSHWQILDRSDEHTDRFPVPDLYREFRGRDDVILIPHVGGRYADLQNHFDESLMPLVEICSCWGVFEWFADDAFRRGHRFGVSAGSDDHTARPGMSAAPRGHFATGGGLTAVLAREKSREAIWDALKAGRTYATTGARIILDVTTRTGDRVHPIGSLVPFTPGLRLDVTVHATAPLWRAEVLRWLLSDGGSVVYSHRFDRPQLPASRQRLRIGWTGARIRARHRLTDWSGSLSVTDGRILRVEGWGFDHPENGVTGWSERHVTWASETAGDWDGILIDLEGDDSTRLRFATRPTTFEFSPRDCANRPIAVDAGGVGQRVEVERDPGPTNRSLSFSYAIADAPTNRDPYIVRITQQDGHVAWFSPIYVVSAER